MEHDAHVDERLQNHGDGDADGDVPSEIVQGDPVETEAAPEDDDEAAEQQGAAEQSEFLANDGTGTLREASNT